MGWTLMVFTTPFLVGVKLYVRCFPGYVVLCLISGLLLEEDAGGMTALPITVRSHLNLSEYMYPTRRVYPHLIGMRISCSSRWLPTKEKHILACRGFSGAAGLQMVFLFRSVGGTLWLRQDIINLVRLTMRRRVVSRIEMLNH